jgi:membrane fusion protein
VNESLFRKEVIRTQGERLLGEVTLSQPVSYYIYCFFVFSITFVALLFLAFNKYSRKQTVVGFLAPDNDIIRVYPPQTGILNQFLSDEDYR